MRRLVLQQIEDVMLRLLLHQIGDVSRGGLGIRRDLFKMAANLHILEKMK